MTQQSSYVIYEDRKYVISEFMLKESSLIKETLLSTGEYEIHLSLFEKEFIQLNNSSRSKFTEYKTVEEVNHMYDVLGYFGLDCLIQRLHTSVFIYELFRIPEHLNFKEIHYFLETRKIQFSSLHLPESVFESNLEYVHWTTLCKNTSISEEFFERYLYFLDWNSLCGNPNMSEAFFRRHFHKILWPTLCTNTNISEEFFEENIRNVYWIWICKNTNISEAFFERHLEMIHWSSLSNNSNISKAFIDRHAHIANPNTPIAEAFFHTHSDIDWDSLSRTYDSNKYKFNFSQLKGKYNNDHWNLLR
jgi:hypothetical protein